MVSLALQPVAMIIAHYLACTVLSCVIYHLGNVLIDMVWNRVIRLVARFHVTFLSGCIACGQEAETDVIMTSLCLSGALAGNHAVWSYKSSLHFCITACSLWRSVHVAASFCENVISPVITMQYWCWLSMWKASSLFHPVLCGIQVSML